MYRFFILVILSSATVNLYAQETGPTQAPQSGFQLGSNNLGAVTNAVNTFTGDLNLPFNLYSTSSHDGIGISVDAIYNSNIQGVNDTWNVEAPTGVLGMGWSLNLPQIVVDSKFTAARDDNQYYINDGSGSVELINYRRTGTVNYYTTKIYKKWLVKYDESSETWTIIKEDGNTYIFGDDASGRNTVEWAVSWGNWTGSSVVSTGQQQFPVAWNLSKVLNRYKESLTYTYVATNQNVGSQSYTESSNIKKIENSWGDEVEFVYANKLAHECPDPHAENGEHVADAYQERVNKFYLDYIITKNTYGTVTNTSQIKFNYSTTLLGTGLLTKRLLTSVDKYDGAGTVKVFTTTFGYVSSGPMIGALSTISTSLGGVVSVGYHPGLNIEMSNRVFSASDGCVPTYFGEDYTVELLTTTARVYSWDGYWQSTSFNIGTVNYHGGHPCSPDIKVQTSKKFVAFLNPINSTSYKLSIARKSEINHQWIIYTSTVDVGAHDTNKEELIVGEDFVAVGASSGILKTFTWDGTTWNASTMSTAVGRRINFGANNYLITHNPTVTPGPITFRYLNERKEWVTLSGPALSAGTGDSFWYGTNAFALAMNGGGTEKVLHWSPDYSSLFWKDLNVSFTNDLGTQILVNNSSITAIVVGNTKFLRSFRFNGTNWGADSGNKVFVPLELCSVGEDIFLWHSTSVTSGTQTGNYKIYNPNSGQWNSDVSVTFSRSSNFNSVYTTNSSKTGLNAFAISDRIYFRNRNGSVTSKFMDPTTGGGIEGRTFQAGLNYFMYYSPSIGRWHVRFIKNGDLGDLKSTNAFSSQNYYWPATSGPQIYMTGPTSFKTRSGALSKIIDNEFTGDPVDYPVTLITVDDGIASTHTTYSYDESTVVLDHTGTVAQYERVKIIPGSTNESHRPYGYTEMFYINGRLESTVSHNYDRDLDGQLVPDANAATHFKLLNGSIHRILTFNNSSSSTPTSEKFFNWKVESKPVQRYGSSSQVAVSYSARLIKTTEVLDGIKKYTKYEYNGYEQLSRSITYVSSATLPSNDPSQHYGNGVLETEYLYWWQQYDITAGTNLMTPIVQVTKKLNGQAKESSVTRWKRFPCTNCDDGLAWAASDSYKWSGTGTPSFPNWFDENDPQAQAWLTIEMINVRDEISGIPIEIEDGGGRITSTILDTKRRNVIAIANNARRQDIHYQNFEVHPSTNLSNTAKAGSKSLLGTFNVYTPNTPNTSLILTYWMLATLETNSKWTYYSVPIGSQSVITIGGTGKLLDEIRIYPADAQMVSYSIDSKDNLVTINSTINEFEYREYDGLNRVRLVRDNEGKIVKQVLYTTKY